MTETADDLSAPLGQDKPRRKRRLRLPFTAMQALAVMLGLFLFAFAAFYFKSKTNPGHGGVFGYCSQQRRPQRRANRYDDLIQIFTRR